MKGRGAGGGTGSVSEASHGRRMTPGPTKTTHAHAIAESWKVGVATNHNNVRVQEPPDLRGTRGDRLDDGLYQAALVQPW